MKPEYKRSNSRLHIAFQEKACLRNLGATVWLKRRGQGRRMEGERSSRWRAALTSSCWSHNSHRAWVSFNARCVTKDVSVRMMRDGWEAQTSSVTPTSEEDRREGRRRVFQTRTGPQCELSQEGPRGDGFRIYPEVKPKGLADVKREGK